MNFSQFLPAFRGNFPVLAKRKVKSKNEKFPVDIR